MRLFLLLLLALLPRAAHAQPSTTPPDALFLDGLAHALLDNHSEAIDRFRQVLALAPDQPTVLSALASSYEAVGETRMALQAATDAARLAPSNAHFTLEAARLAQQNGDAPGAETRLRDFLRRHPDAEHVQDELARLLEARGAVDEALALLEALPATPQTLDRRLALYSQTQNDAAFEMAYGLRARLAPPTPVLLRHLAAYYLRRDRPSDARHALEDALRLDASDREARQLLATLDAPGASPALSPGFAAYVAADFAVAARLLQAELDRDAGDVVRWAALAMAYLEAGEPDRARLVLEDAQLIFFDAPALRVPATYLALQAGDASGAARLAASAPESEGVVHAALGLAQSAVLKAQGDLAAAQRAYAAATTQTPLEGLRAQALAPAGGALQKLLPDA